MADKLVSLNRAIEDLPPGNWWDFPPPRPGVYNTRRIRGDTNRCDFYPNQVMTPESKMLNRFPAEAGWQFQFKSSPIQWFPVEVLYQVSYPPGSAQVRGNPIRGERVGTRDLRAELPQAYSREEAWYIITQLPRMWPTLSRLHVEFVEQTH